VKTWQKMLISMLITLAIGGAYLFSVWRHRQNPGVIPQDTTRQTLSKDDLVVMREFFPMHFEDTLRLEGTTVWEKNGYVMPYYSYTGGQVLFAKQADKHIIFVMHEDVKIVENVHSVGGPAHPGREMTEYIPAQFNTVIRLIRETVLVPGNDAPRDVVIAITENDGKFIAKMRTADEENPNPLARVYLDRNPSSYWPRYVAESTSKSTTETGAVIINGAR